MENKDIDVKITTMASGRVVIECKDMMAGGDTIHEAILELARLAYSEGYGAEKEDPNKLPF